MSFSRKRPDVSGLIIFVPTVHWLPPHRNVVALGELLQGTNRDQGSPSDPPYRQLPFGNEVVNCAQADAQALRAVFAAEVDQVF